MHLQVVDVEASDLTELAVANLEAFRNPNQTLRYVFYPPLEDENAENEFYTKWLKGQMESQRPKKLWVKVVDADAENKIVGAARWLIYADGDPFAEDQDKDDGNQETEKKKADDNAAQVSLMSGFAAGSVEEKFMARTIAQMETGRKKYARRPHLYLISAFTIPSYRRRGVGKLFMKSGIAMADQMGLECWLESTWMANELYEAHGFVPVCKVTVDPPMPDGLTDEEKTAWEGRRELAQTPLFYTLMWRPKGGEFVDGVTVKPWEAEIGAC